MSPERRERDRRELARRLPIERRKRMMAAFRAADIERAHTQAQNSARVSSWLARFDAARAIHHGAK